MSADITVPASDTAVPVIPEQRSYFDSLIANADRVDGGELVKGETLALLKGVPFAITKVHYREGDVKDKTTGLPTCYTSLEITLGDEKWLTKRRVNLATFPFIPEENLIFNDGSTGVKRQMTNYLHAKGFIVVRKDPDKLVMGGAKGESSFDLPPGDWDDIPAENGKLTINDNGFPCWEFTLPVPLFCVRGLRPSEYSNDYAKDAVTWYLA